MRGTAHEPREVGVALAVVDCVAELVEHRVHPPLARFHVAEHAHVTGAVDVDAERVLTLAVTRVEVAAVEHRADVETESVVGAHGQRLEVGVGEQVVDGDGALSGWGLEERVVVVPRAQVGDRAAESPGETLVDRGLPVRERHGSGAVDVAERSEEPALVELAGGEREGEVVARAQCLRGLVAQPGQLADAVGDLGADLLRRLPGRATLLAVVARAQDLGDGVVVDASVSDAATEVVERRLDACLELDDPTPQVSRHLVGHEGVVQHVELATEQRIVVAIDVLTRGADRGEQARVGEQLAASELGRGAAFVGRGRRLRVRLPPRFTQLPLERPQARFDVGDELGGGGHGADLRDDAESCMRASGGEPGTPARSGRPVESEGGTTQRNRPSQRRCSGVVHASERRRAGYPGSQRATRRVGGRDDAAESTISEVFGGGDHGPGVSGEGLVDHLALERDGGLTSCHCLLVGEHEPARAVDLFG